MALINQLRNKFNRSRKKPVSVDSFIYSLSEETELLRKSQKVRQEVLHPSLEDFLAEGEKSPSERVDELCNWHREKSEDSLFSGSVDYLKMVSASLPLAAFCFDLGRLLKELDLNFPFLEKEEVEKKLEEEVELEETTSAAVVENIEEDLTSSLEEESSETEVKEELSDSHEEEGASEEALEEGLEEELEEEQPQFLRQELEDLLEKHFPLYKDYLLHFLDWSYSEDFAREFDFDSLPPSGRALGLIKRRFPTSELVWGKTAVASKSQSSASQEKTSSFDEKKAMDEVHEALRNLKRDKRLASIQLKPQNSYLRRLQHNLAVAKGFDSKSSGAEPSRFVVIQKKKS